MKAVTYGIDTLGNIEAAISEVERICLEDASIESDVAKVICAELRNIRRHLMLDEGVSRHTKFL